MDVQVRSALHALGSGGTVEMAERVVEWARRAQPGGIPPERIGGLAEVAALLGKSKQAVNNWILRGNQSTPEPVTELAATKVWDLEQWKVWALGHPELVGDTCMNVHDSAVNRA